MEKLFQPQLSLQVIAAPTFFLSIISQEWFSARGELPSAAAGIWKCMRVFCGCHDNGVGEGHASLKGEGTKDLENEREK